MSALATPKLGTYAVFSALGVLATLALQRPEPLILTAPFLVTLAAGLTVAHAPTLDIRYHLTRTRMLEGEDTAFEIVIVATRAVDRLEILPVLPTGLDAGVPARVVALRLASGETRRFHYQVHAQRWGGYRLGAILLRARDDWGFLVYDLHATARLALRVYPRLETLRDAARPAKTQALAGNETARQGGEGIEFAGVRDFVPGDRVRRINWRLSARRGRLAVNEQHPERNADVVLFLDTFLDPVTGGAGLLEIAVRAVASLARYYGQSRDRVGLVSFGGELRWMTPAVGNIQLYRIVESLLDTQVVLSYAWKGIDVLPYRTLPPQALVVALTPLLDDRSSAALLNLAARGFDLAIIEVSPVPYVTPEPGIEGDMALRLWQMRRDERRFRYQRLGVPVAVWEAGQPLDAALQEVAISQRFARRLRR